MNEGDEIEKERRYWRDIKELGSDKRGWRDKRYWGNEFNEYIEEGEWR